jgi:SAM-dependent methyltransferase
MPSGEATNRFIGEAGTMWSSALRGVQWGLDRMLSVGYGFAYDYIFESFAPYQDLRREVLELVEAAVPAGAHREAIRVLNVECGPGNLAINLAEAGFAVVGLDRYGALIEVAREKRRAKHLTNLAFQHADLADGNTFREGAFDQVVSVHALYVHPNPSQKLTQVHRVLKPGGHVVFVNHTRRLGLRTTLGDSLRREGLRAALRCLLWLLPNAIFEATRRRIGPHYWGEGEFAARLREAGFTVLAMRRTFLNGASLLVWARRDTEE